MIVADEEGEDDLPDFSRDFAHLRSKNWKCRRNQVKNTGSDEPATHQVDQGKQFHILLFISLLRSEMLLQENVRERRH